MKPSIARTANKRKPASKGETSMKLKFYTACYYLASDLAIFCKDLMERRMRVVRRNIRIQEVRT